MDVDSMRNPTRRLKIQEAWEAGWSMAQDPVIAWEMACGKAMEIFKQFHKEDWERLTKLKENQVTLEALREKIQVGADFEEIEAYRRLEHSVHKDELLQASILRRRSRVQWAKEGDASNKYFFNCLKTKQVQERITSPVGENDQIVEDEDKILQLELAAPPSSKEITELVEALPTNKAPGEDGLTAEVLRESWQWTGDKCVRFIQEIWSHHNLPENNKTAVVKLLPKNSERRQLKNWRPISLLSISYKLIGRILSTRLKKFLPRIIDIDQTGFVEGRIIMDNVLNLKLCQDLTNVTGELAIFCKLDFEKAFDRVQHSFLWETLQKLNFCPKFLQITHMLVTKGRAKVSVNGRFTPSFRLQRGVRQGCPVSPLLFAISTQPLMRLLREGERHGTIKGVQIPGGGKPILHKLFADDSGICISATEANFQALTRIVNCFERVSGAKLNLAKSVIIPMVLDRSTPWLSSTGCKILSSQEEVKYMGCLAGNDVGEASLQRDLVDKFGRKLTHWTTRFLTWPSKITLARHVLRALPIYQLLGLGIPDAGFNRLESLCRSFVWGTGANGKPKMTLIAWSRTTTQKQNGGLGLRPFRDTRDILKMKYIARLLQGENSEWADMMKFILRTEMNKMTKGKTYRWWTVEEGLLLLPNIPTPKGSRTRHFIQAWKRFRAYLTVSPDSWSLPGSITLSQLSILTKRYGSGYTFNNKILNPLLKKLRYSVLIHLQTPSGGWRDIHRELTEIGVILSPAQEAEIGAFKIFLDMVSTDATSLQSSVSWRWHGDDSTWKVNFLDAIDMALFSNKMSCPLLHILATTLQYIWKDRNLKQFKNQDTTTPIEVILTSARHEVEGQMTHKGSAERWEDGLKMLQDLARLLNESTLDDENPDEPALQGNSHGQSDQGRETLVNSQGQETTSSGDERDSRRTSLQARPPGSAGIEDMLSRS
ncbi:hypothetical protein R1sor_025587 [Riccia sorocarpa]|uniref:Reverse transcriptase domain-containing protein n=1 Tax=Riccia sorocarpa TaxID=122646 RepID=A0ABD3GCY4_9MARC